jgi:hypothetical protein
VSHPANQPNGIMEQSRKVRENFLSRRAAEKAATQIAVDAIMCRDLTRPPPHTDAMREYAEEFRLLVTVHAP